MIRILHIIGSMNAGGMETMIMNYYRNIDRNKIQFDFLINSEEKCFYEDEIIRLGGIIYRVVSRRKDIVNNRKQVKEFFKYNKYKVAHFHQGITYYYPLLVAKKYGVEKRIIHNHGIDAKYKKYLKIYINMYAKKRICSLATKYISCSENVNNDLFTKKIISSNKIIILNNAIDVEKYKYNEEYKKEMLSKLNLEGKKIYGHIGTFTYPKNHTFLIDIFNDIYKKESDSCLLLVGEGPLLEEIREKVKRYKLEKKVFFLGVRDDVNKILSAIDVLIFPSIFEGLPLTLIEAQASGVKIFTSDSIEKNVDIINNCTFISLDTSTEEWSEKIVKYGSNDNRKRYNEIVVESEYNIQNKVKELEELYLEGEKY